MGSAYRIHSLKTKIQKEYKAIYTEIDPKNYELQLKQTKKDKTEAKKLESEEIMEEIYMDIQNKRLWDKYCKK